MTYRFVKRPTTPRNQIRRPKTHTLGCSPPDSAILQTHFPPTAQRVDRNSKCDSRSLESITHFHAGLAASRHRVAFPTLRFRTFDCDTCGYWQFQWNPLVQLPATSVHPTKTVFQYRSTHDRVSARP